jgi:hypothetical protein
MKKNSTVFIVLLFFSCMNAFAQEWSREDSLWLKNVLEGKEELKINEDTKKAIDEGRLIVPQWMRDNDSYTKPELEKDFDEIGAPDSIRFRHLDPYTMPPGVFALYVLYMDRLDSAYRVRSLIITDDEREQFEELAEKGLYMNGPFTSDYSYGVIGGLDFNHALSILFSSHYRQMARNRKIANAYKNYYDAGAVKQLQISERERKQLNQAVNNRRPVSIKVSPGQRINGIDN